MTQTDTAELPSPIVETADGGYIIKCAFCEKDVLRNKNSYSDDGDIGRDLKDARAGVPLYCCTKCSIDAYRTEVALRSLDKKLIEELNDMLLSELEKKNENEAD